jgi:hypothetical protein
MDHTSRSGHGSTKRRSVLRSMQDAFVRMWIQMMLSVIVPCFNAANTIGAPPEALANALMPMLLLHARAYD